MPRPKRTKVAPSAPAPRPGKSMRVASPAPAAAFNDLHDTSDAEGIAARGVGNIKKNGKGKAAAAGLDAQEIVRDETSNGAKGGSKSIQTAPDAQNNQNDAGIYAAESSPELEVSRREPETGTFGRARHSSFLSRPVRRGRSSSVESNLEYNGTRSMSGKNTPSFDTGSFARRHRQSSVVGRSHQTMGSSSMATPAHGGSTMKFGSFRRRAREPSILGTAHKELQLPPDSDLDDEEDFNPDDESTPLNLPKTRTRTSSSIMPGSIPRKRKLSSVPAPSRSTRQESREAAPTGGHSSDTEDNPALSSPGETPIPSIEARPLTPQPISPTMAPPQSTDASSSPELPSIRRPISRGRRLLRGRTPVATAQDSPVSSPPSLTHSPNRRYINTRTTQTKDQLPPSTYSTAQLQALLPRRRRHATRDSFDIPTSGDEVDTSGLASDDDELTSLNARARTRRTALSKALVGAKKASKPKPSKAIAKPVQRTYGLRSGAVSDKENDGPNPDDSLAPLPDDENEGPRDSHELEAKISNELKLAARKFEEVDQWELEFEDVAAGSSSPRDAR